MDLNTKIAERRAELQREQVAEDARRRQEALELEQRRQAQERAIKESAEKEAAQKIQAIEAQLQGRPAMDPERISQEAEKKVDAHIRTLARERITKGENWKFVFLLFGSVLGFFMTWWLGLGMLIWTGYYLTKVSSRHEAEIRAELARSKEGRNR